MKADLLFHLWRVYVVVAAVVVVAAWHFVFLAQVVCMQKVEFVQHHGNYNNTDDNILEERVSQVVLLLSHSSHGNSPGFDNTREVLEERVSRVVLLLSHSSHDNTREVLEERVSQVVLLFYSSLTDHTVQLQSKYISRR